MRYLPNLSHTVRFNNVQKKRYVYHVPRNGTVMKPWDGPDIDREAFIYCDSGLPHDWLPWQTLRSQLQRPLQPSVPPSQVQGTWPTVHPHDGDRHGVPSINGPLQSEYVTAESNRIVELFAALAATTKEASLNPSSEPTRHSDSVLHEHAVAAEDGNNDEIEERPEEEHGSFRSTEQSLEQVVHRHRRRTLAHNIGDVGRPSGFNPPLIRTT